MAITVYIYIFGLPEQKKSSVPDLPDYDMLYKDGKSLLNTHGKKHCY